MAAPTTRSAFKGYCMKALGVPVITVNVDDDQVEDRIDEALDYWINFNHDAVQIVPLKHQLTANNIADKYITVNPNVVSVEYILPINSSSGSSTGSNMFDIEYQIRLNDYLTYTTTSTVDMFLLKRHLEFVDDIYNGVAPIEFNRHMNRIYPYWDWADVAEGDWIIIMCRVSLDGTEFPNIWKDRILQKYAIALIKRQWGNNMKKFEGTKLLGGVTLNGQKIFDEAMEEIKEIEIEMRSTYEEPPHFITG